MVSIRANSHALPMSLRQACGLKTSISCSIIPTYQFLTPHWKLKLYITCEKFQTILIPNKKVSKNKTVRNFEVSESLSVQKFYGTAKPCWYCKPKQTRYAKEGLGDDRNSESCH